jgi:hypothetical protein
VDLEDVARRFYFLIRDRDATFTAAVDAVFTAIDIRIIRTPAGIHNLASAADLRFQAAGFRTHRSANRDRSTPNPSCFAAFVDHVPAAGQAVGAAGQAVGTARDSCGVTCSGHGPRNLAAMMTRRSVTALSS